MGAGHPVSTYRILTGDCIEQMRTLPKKSVHCVIFSPPYFLQRDYEIEGQIGQEETPADFITSMQRVFHAIRRVLRDDGTVWMNIGDSYANDAKWGGATGGKHCRDLHGTNRCRDKRKTGFKQKDRMGIPHRLVFALQDDGWYFRDEIIWAKPNPMTDSAKDRCGRAHEFVFLLTKTPTYFYDYVAIQEPAVEGGMRNKRSVWEIPVANNREKHFAGYPRKLVLPCVLAGTSERGCCPKCGAQYLRRIKKIRTATRPGRNTKVTGTTDKTHGNRDPERHVTSVKTIGWKPGCECNAGPPVPCTVLDPFGGTGTTGAVAVSRGRNAILIELNPEYVGFIKRKMKTAIAKRGFGIY
jgi:DNA modification methylase